MDQIQENCTLKCKPYELLKFKSFQIDFGTLKSSSRLIFNSHFDANENFITHKKMTTMIPCKCQAHTKKWTTGDTNHWVQVGISYHTLKPWKLPSNKFLCLFEKWQLNTKTLIYNFVILLYSTKKICWSMPKRVSMW